MIIGSIISPSNEYSSNKTIINNTFYGLSAFSLISMDVFNIDLRISNYALTNFNSGNYSYYIMPYLTFSTDDWNPSCCRNTPYNDGLDTCFDKCLLSYYATIYYVCVKCPLPDCIACDNATYCTKCGLGKLVRGLCTLVNGCSSVDYSISSISNNCQKCSDAYIYDSSANTCNCSQGLWVITGCCTDNHGCVSAYCANNKTFCRTCSSSHFQLIGNLCDCTKGFILSNQSGKC
jgi:hypothetical protein